MPTISVPQSFFISERNSIYSDWKQSFWRELLSNAIDAGSSRIHIRTRFDATGDFVCDVLDNGCGMDRETIETIYMRLGASTKTDDTSSVGGFGRARILTCFSQKKYQIRTSDVLVQGAGSEFEIQASDRSVKGCAISITTEPENARRLHRGLFDVLRQSSLRAAISLDLAEKTPDDYALPQPDPDTVSISAEGDPPRFRGWSRRGRKFAELSDEKGKWADLHVCEGATTLKGCAVVRVNGMAMYDDHVSAGLQITVDLNPARAREVLTASRDSIRYEFRSELQKLFAKIAADHRSALRDRGPKPETVISRPASGQIGSKIGDAIKSSVETAKAPPQDADPNNAGFCAPEQTEIDLARIRQDQQARRAPSPLNMEEHFEERGNCGLRLPVVIKIEDPTAAQRAALQRYMPQTWIGSGGEGRSAELLHAAWTAACRHVLRQLCQTYSSLRDETFLCGFIVDRSIRGLHGAVGEIQHGLFLNPIDEAGKMRFRLSDPADMKRLVALAIHEVVHCVHDWHDEAFAGTMTDLVAEIRDRDIEREIREELDLAREWIEARREREIEISPSEP